MLNTKNIIKDGKTLVTKDLQALIDKAYELNEALVINEGIYLTSSLFLHSNMEILFENKAILLATTKEDEYPILNTRVAGINMPWYVGILNIEACENVKISGKGVIDGDGPYWWNKYWGLDLKSGMRKEYDVKGLRWACDYDCMRPRNLVISNSSNITISDIESRNSGFWNIHVLYSHDVNINNVSINLEANDAPSTDGIDIDSSYNVLVENVVTNCNDDSICIKSGRDYDGYKTNIASHDITIRNSTIKKGFGVTIGSEVSGGIFNITIDNLKYYGTDCGFRIKSSQNRRGYIKNVRISNIEMINVKYLFHICLDWNPNYSICKIPDNYSGNILPHYKTLTTILDKSIPHTIVSELYFDNINAYFTSDYKENSRIFTLVGYSDIFINSLYISNSKLYAKEYGILKYANKPIFDNVDIKYDVLYDQKYDDYDNR